MWTLIFVLMTGDGVTIHDVDGFQSRESCLAAIVQMRVPEERGREFYGWCVDKAFQGQVQVPGQRPR